MKLWVIIISILLIILLGVQLWYTFLPGTKGPTYTLIEKRGAYEIRQYDPYLIAQVFLSGSYREVTNEGFRVLAHYIFGGNKENISMPMTTPVFIEKQEKKDGYNVAFVMPEKYDKKTLPKPNDTQVKIKEKHTQLIAAYPFTWYATAKSFEQKKKEFLTLLEQDNVKVISDVVLARYNPPFILPFLMRNELLVVIKK